MSRLSLRSVLSFLIIPALLLAPGCANTKRAARTSPERDTDSSVTGQVALPAETARREPAFPASRAAAADTVEAVIASAQEEYDEGLEALKSDEAEQARAHFDAAVQIYMNSSVTVEQDSRLRQAFDKLVEDIAALEADLEETSAAPPDATPSPTEELQDITTYLTPEEARKELEQIAPEMHRVSFDIPMVVNEKVLGWIDIFKKTPAFRTSFIGGYQRYGWYEEMIHGIFKEEGLPADLIYMAFLESTYKTSAYSRARAKGIWQFMTPTGRQYGLKINRYVDERSHPEKSTRAAARYMKDLYAMLGDWHLAIAAYNTGAGNILRAQRRSGKTSYWDLAKSRHMRLETKNFVPAILALALMGKDPAKYGFEGLEHNAPLQFDRVKVAGPTQLSLVARLAGVSEEDVRFLNPHLRLGVTPPGERNYEVLLPTSTGPLFTAAYLAMPEEERVARLAKVHIVRRGETLSTIAARYGTSIQELKASNNIRNTRRISVGTQLTVPNTPGGADLYDDSDAGVSRRSRRTVQAGTKYAPFHVVRRGETLSSIARTYGVSLRNVLAWNGLTRRSVIRPGKRLVVGHRPSSGTRASAGSRSTSQPATGMVSVPGGGETRPDPAGSKVLYRVRRGDNLFRIALKYGTSVENLKAWNNITGNGIRAGTLLTIYPN